MIHGVSSMESSRSSIDEGLWRRWGFAGQIGFGIAPALLIVDAARAFTSPASPLGSDVESVVLAIRELLFAARETDVPIIFTTVAYSETDLAHAGHFLRKVPALHALRAGSDEVRIDDRLVPLPGEPIVVKKFASSFFGTNLVEHLNRIGIDTLIITGFTTSGCVRATVVDALQFGFRPIVPQEAVGDRNPLAHKVSLMDMHAKYADVVSVEEVLRYFRNPKSASR